MDGGKVIRPMRWSGSAWWLSLVVTLSAYIRTTVYRHVYRQNRSKSCNSRNLHNKVSDQNFDILFFTVTRRVEPTKDRVETPNIDGDTAVARFSMPIWPRRSRNFLMRPKWKMIAIAKSVFVPNLVKIEDFTFTYFVSTRSPTVGSSSSSYQFLRTFYGYIGYIGNIDDHTKFLRRTM